MDLNIMVGGEAGQGIQTMGLVLAKVMSRGGFHVFADNDYESRVRGGHNFFRIRVSDIPIHAISENIDILIAMNTETITLHNKESNLGGIIIYDGTVTKSLESKALDFNIPFEKLALESSGNKLTSNSIAMGAVLGLIGYPFEILADVLRWYFAKAGSEVQETNVKAGLAGYKYAQSNKQKVKISVKPINNSQRMLLNGNEALSLGAMAAGCKFLAAYPMTPTSSILEYMAAKASQYKIAVIQPEDEIAAINMAIGAAYTGVRAMTVTSGGGFCLMVEGLSLAGMTETPVVIVLGQRPGPAIGLPTRTEQGELEFAIHAGHGEFPRAILAPATIQDAFYLTAKAFNLADKYQIPVIIMTDSHLASSYGNVDKFELKAVVIDRGELLSAEQVDSLTAYKRYQITASGISPRAIPLQGKALIVADSDEHNEEGHIIEDAETRNQMMLKRMRKVAGLKSEISIPHVKELPNAEMTLIGWGSTYGAIDEAARLLLKEGIAANTMHFTELWPFPAEEVTEMLHDTHKTIVIENNATGQLARLIRAETGHKISRSICKFDGRPFTPQYILRELKREVF